MSDHVIPLAAAFAAGSCFATGVIALHSRERLFAVVCALLCVANLSVMVMF